MDKPILKVEIKYEHDVVLARQRARQIAGLVGFESQDQVRIATSVSELARNAFQYAGGGSVEFTIAGKLPQSLKVVVRDHGHGIAHLDTVLGGNYQSKTGMGVGIIGARRLMDHFDVDSTTKGTTITISKELPRHASAITSKDFARIADALASQTTYEPFQEIQRQNQELLSALDELQKQRTTLSELNQELEETNRGVVALYAELDERADYLKRASELKTQFLSNMTHEFRTPLNSILSISQILLDHMDGELNSEQKKQVGFIQSGAKSLLDLVNDLLDLAKVEAGKVTINPAKFEADETFRILRGILKPLIKPNSHVKLIFDEPENIPTLFNDEGKVSQILRNFISNGLKYTQKGEVRVTVKQADNDTVIFSVRDTGIGIKDNDHALIFEEFAQVESRHQHKVKGTGLGLPLSRKLAELLGGHVLLESIPGKGSTFSLVMPIRYTGPKEVQYDEAPSEAPMKYERLLIIDDNSADRYVVKKLIGNYAQEICEATNAHEGLEMAARLNPSAIILDLVMPDLSGEEVLDALKKQKNTRRIPVIINTSKVLTQKERSALESKASAVLTKGSANQKTMAQELDNALQKIAVGPKKVLSHV